MPAKSLQGSVVPWRNNTCSSVGTAEPATPHLAAAIRLNIEDTEKNASGAIQRTIPGATSAPPHTAKNNVQTNIYAQRASGSQIRFILPSLNHPPILRHTTITSADSDHVGQRSTRRRTAESLHPARWLRVKGSQGRNGEASGERGNCPATQRYARPVHTRLHQASRAPQPARSAMIPTGK